MKKLTAPLIILLGLTACNETPVPTQVDLCTQTVLDYAELRDDPSKAEEYGALFTEDGMFKLGPSVSNGRDNIVYRHQQANKAQRWHHTMEDISISEDGKSGKSRVVVYTAPLDQPDIVSRFIIANYTDRFEMVEGNCKIAGRNVAIIFDSLTAD